MKRQGVYRIKQEGFSFYGESSVQSLILNCCRMALIYIFVPRSSTSPHTRKRTSPASRSTTWWSPSRTTSARRRRGASSLASLTSATFIQLSLAVPGNTKGGSINVLLTSSLTRSDFSVLQIKNEFSVVVQLIPLVKQEVNGTVIFPPVVFPGCTLPDCLGVKAVGRQFRGSFGLFQGATCTKASICLAL